MSSKTFGLSHNEKAEETHARDNGSHYAPPPERQRRDHTSHWDNMRREAISISKVVWLNKEGDRVIISNKEAGNLKIGLLTSEVGWRWMIGANPPLHQHLKSTRHRGLRCQLPQLCIMHDPWAISIFVPATLTATLPLCQVQIRVYTHGE